MIRIYSPEEVLKIAKPCFGGWDLSFNMQKISGVYINEDQKFVTKEMTIKILDKINTFFPLHWCDVDILCLPFRPMLKDTKGVWTGMDYNGQAWKGLIALGAQLRVGTELFASTMILHELWHEFAYRFIDETPFDGSDTKEYRKFKEIMGILDYRDSDLIWEDRPSEILAELGRYYASDKDFTWEEFITFNDKYDPLPLREGYDYLMSFMPAKPIEQKDFIENRTTSAPGVPDVDDLILNGGEDDMIIKMNIGKKEYYVDGVAKIMLEAPLLKNGVTLVPLRLISELYNAKVEWDGKTQTVTITK